MDDNKNPLAGVDLAEARSQLAGITVDLSLDTDFLAVDDADEIAVFLGEESTQVPSLRGAAMTSKVLEGLARAVVARAERSAGYREAAEHTNEVYFDVPRSSETVALHERPVAGYPHLVVASPSGVAAVRYVLDTFGGREVASPDGFAVALDVLGAMTEAELHRDRACAGCRVLDDPADPRPRSPEALARAGLHVYTAGSDGWVRVASPTRGARHGDLADVRLVRARLTTFASTRWLPRDWFVG